MAFQSVDVDFGPEESQVCSSELLIFAAVPSGRVHAGLPGQCLPCVLLDLRLWGKE